MKNDLFVFLNYLDIVVLDTYRNNCNKFKGILYINLYLIFDYQFIKI
jgi:hypothetical protein